MSLQLTAQPRGSVASPLLIGLPPEIEACLFDLDGVLTQTAKVHAAAWKTMFDEYMRERAQKGGEEFREFDPVRESSSTNCRDVLDAAGILDLFEVIVDGIVAEREHLAGKPAPDTFLAAGRKLGVAPAHAAVFEDALAGVQAGHAGSFGLVVGVDRVGQADALKQHGADVVVKDLAELLEHL